MENQPTNNTSKPPRKLDAQLNPASLINAGLQLHAVFDLDSLPGDIRADIAELTQGGDYTQLLVFAHVGNTLWDELQAGNPDLFRLEHPIDDYSLKQVEAWLETQGPDLDYQVLYPGGSPSSTQSLNLQALGKLAGWHHDSPLKIGIHAEYGSWFAYRVVIACNSQFTNTERECSVSPCLSCRNSPCMRQCPVDAVSATGLDLDSCISYRRSPNSACQDRCLARSACPIGTAYRYSPGQMAYYYTRSLQTIKKHAGQKPQ